MQKHRLSEAQVVDGDTLIDVSPSELLEFAKCRRADVALALKRCDDVSRYGDVRIDSDGYIVAFNEKGRHGPGLVNAGLYYIGPVALAATPAKGSFEREVLMRQYATLALTGLTTDAYFIDIGMPEDLARAHRELGNIQHA